MASAQQAAVQQAAAQQAAAQGDARQHSSPQERGLRRALAMAMTAKRHSMNAESAARFRIFFKKAEKNYRSISWPLSLRKFFRSQS